MKSCWLVITAAFLLVAGVTGRAAAQGSSWTVNPYAGVYLADDSGLKDASSLEGVDISIDPAFLVGGRLGYMSGSNWGFAAAYGYSPVTASLSGFGESADVDVKAHLYYGEVEYTFPTSGPASVFVAAGAGGIFLKADIPPELAEPGDEDSSNNLLVNLGAGLRWSVNDRWAVRADAKDHIQFCKMEKSDTEFSICPDDDKALNNFEISGGLEIMVGGR